MIASADLIEYAESKLIVLAKASLWQQYERWTRRYRNAVERKVKGFFSQQESEIIRNIEAGKSVNIKAVADWLDVGRWILTFEEYGQLFLPKVVGDKGELEMGKLLIGVTFDVENPRVSAFISRRKFRFAKDISNTTQKQLQEVFRVALNEGEGIYEMTKRVQALFESKKKYEAERIARSEVIRASNFGAEQAYLQSGVVSEKEWIVSRDERLCPFCQPMNGRRVVVGMAYFQRGDVIHGTDEEGNIVSANLDYEDIFHPPLHPNCRCTLSPVVEF